MKVIVIGAGVAGLSIGWRLAQTGVETLVLERSQPARGATWAAAGMLAATAETVHASPTETQFAKYALGLWPDFAREIEETTGLRIAYRRDGALLIARDAAEAGALKTGHAPGAAFLSAEKALAKVPLLSPDIVGALWAPDEAQVDNRALGRALAAAFLQAGGTLQTHETAVRVEAAAGGGMAVLTPFSVRKAEIVLLAAGAWTGQIDGLPAGATLPVRPVKGEMLALSPPEGAKLPQPYVWGHDIYVVPRGSVLFVGATVSDSGYDTTLTEEAVDWLRSRAIALMPDLARWELTERWAGLRPGSPDGLPIVGATAMDNVFVASGQYRNGILLAPAIARSMCDLILGRPPQADISAFDPRRFASETGAP